ncbi:MAG: Glyoxalase/bleomycin resistance protein/dioxygenase [Ilumatobacteraceae bacterium]|nr:Glyoxalase/bleomycin resistance protein/dioxygenase [Ilumatobacteraceae bacterium]
MDITIHSTFLPHNDAEAAIGFYRDVLGFEVRNDVGYQDMRWITVGPVGQPAINIVLSPPAVDPGVTEEERATIVEMMAKGTYGMLVLASEDLDGDFAKIAEHGVEIVEEPTEQPYGARDCSLRDPAGNMIKIQQTR